MGWKGRICMPTRPAVSDITPHSWPALSAALTVRRHAYDEELGQAPPPAAAAAATAATEPLPPPSSPTGEAAPMEVESASSADVTTYNPHVTTCNHL